MGSLRFVGDFVRSISRLQVASFVVGWLVGAAVLLGVHQVLVGVFPVGDVYFISSWVVATVVGLGVASGVRSIVRRRFGGAE